MLGWCLTELAMSLNLIAGNIPSRFLLSGGACTGSTYEMPFVGEGRSISQGLLQVRHGGAQRVYPMICPMEFVGTWYYRGAKKPGLAKLLCAHTGADVEWLMDQINPFFATFKVEKVMSATGS